MKAVWLVALSTLSFFSYGSIDYKKPQTPSELHQLFGEYFSNKDTTGLATLFHDDAVFVLDDEGNLARGKDAIAQTLKGYMQGDVEMLTHRVSIHINGDTALIRSDWEIPNVQTGMALEVMKYSDGGWLYIIDNPNGF
jgi:ketosteroid isomerase-like protein